MAATWNEELVAEGARITALETRAVGLNMEFRARFRCCAATAVVALFRVVWGRCTVSNPIGVSKHPCSAGTGRIWLSKCSCNSKALRWVQHAIVW